MLEILSLGAGVQSSTVFLMSCYGELPKLDMAIFADTGWEPKAVYSHLMWLEKEGRRYGIPIYRVGSGGNIRSDALRAFVRDYDKSKGERWSSLPYFVLCNDGSRGMLRRQCTNEYKIQPIEQFLRREVMKLKPRQHAPKKPVLRQWRGISLDEFRRVRAADARWYTTWHPLVEMRKTRKWCHQWLGNRGLSAPRSACIGCPFHHDNEWRHLRDNSSKEFEDACQFDEAIRMRGGMRGKLFLHEARIPLRDVDLRTDQDKGQLVFWDDECGGICGV